MRRIEITDFRPGQHRNTHALNPPQALAPGLPRDRARLRKPELAVYCLGTGEWVIDELWAHNLGFGESGQIQAGSLAQIFGLRLGYVATPELRIAFPHHPTMSEFQPNVFGWIAGEGLEGTLFHKVGDIGPYVDFKVLASPPPGRIVLARQFRTVREPVGKWPGGEVINDWLVAWEQPWEWDPGYHHWGFLYAHPRWTVFCDGEALGVYDVSPLFDLPGRPPWKTVQAHDAPTNLLIGGTPPLRGVVHSLGYGGGHPVVEFWQSPWRGEWASPIYDLGASPGEFALHAVHLSGRLTAYHDVRVVVRMGNDPLLEDFASVGWRVRGLHSDVTLQPTRFEHLKGRYVQAILVVSSEHHRTPYITRLVIEVREVG
jgi:hypothetical protein